MKLTNLLAALLLALLQMVIAETAAAAEGFGVSAPRDAHEKHDRDDLAAPLRERGEIRGIVGLQTPEETERRFARVPDHVKEQDVSARQQRVLQRLAGRNVRNIKRLLLHHFMAATVDAATLNALLADPEVTSVA